MNIITRIQQKQAHNKTTSGASNNVNAQTQSINSSFDQLLALKNIGFTKVNRNYISVEDIDNPIWS